MVLFFKTYFFGANMMISIFLNSPLKFDCVGVAPAALVDCNFLGLRPSSSSSSFRLKCGSFKIRASDSDYEAAVVAGSVPETSQAFGRDEDAFRLLDECGIMCGPCGGTGWLVCDFCKGQKTNVKAENKRIYRRCPSCRAVGYILCSKCKVFKCVTFPDASDGVDLIL